MNRSRDRFGARGASRGVIGNDGRPSTGADVSSIGIPTNATIKVEFQGADPIAPGSKEVDVATIVPSASTWSSSPTIANGKQFIRWRVTFDITADGSQLETDVRLPIAQSVQVHAEF